MLLLHIPLCIAAFNQQAQTQQGHTSHPDKKGEQQSK